MDLQKIRIRQDLERMVINYRITGDITDEQSEAICNFIDTQIGGGEFSQPGTVGRRIIPFPGSDIVNKSKEKEPDDIPDLREALQRDGLLLIRWEKRTSCEGSFYNVLWMHTIIPRYTEWSGAVRLESIPYVLPLDVDYSDYFHKETRLLYAVQVAPENVLHGTTTEFTAYVQSLKDAGMKDASGKQINFDYVYNFTVEKRERWLQRNRELVDLKLSTRIINALNDMEIYTVKQLKNITVRKLQEARNIGKQTVIETLALLQQEGITLQEEAAELEIKTE
jgi:hypothetical protein